MVEKQKYWAVEIETASRETLKRIQQERLRELVKEVYSKSWKTACSRESVTIPSDASRFVLSWLRMSQTRNSE